MRRKNKVLATALLIAFSAACDDNTISAPYARNLSLSIAGGDGQFALPGDTLEDRLVVRVAHTRTNQPAGNIEVTWSVPDNSGVEVVPARVVTDRFGIAEARVRLGPDTGTVTIEATFEGIWGRAPQFTLTASPAPTIADIQPARVQPGESITIRGSHFRPTLAQNAVSFDGFRATITEASPNELHVLVPPCMTTRRAQVRVGLGGLASAPMAVDVYGAPDGDLQLDVGQAYRFSAAAASCIRIPRDPIGATYLLVAQNARAAGRQPLGFQLSGVAGHPEAPVTFALPVTPAHPLTIAEQWDARLREKEKQIIIRRAFAPKPGVQLQRAIPRTPSLGDERQFEVPGAQLRPIAVSAVVRAVSQHAIIYQDRAAPEGGFTAADFEELARLFDDPIYPTDVDVFGEPSDLDGNGRVIILLSPQVNMLTPRESNGYIGGFFAPCDLDDAIMCGGSLVEIFYAVVPDPDGKFGIAHKRDVLTRSLPSVLAHELQHMIHLNQRVLANGYVNEDPWLQEALAHSAEDTVAGVFEQRGDSVRAQQFRTKNYIRAQYYLKHPASTSIVELDGDGTLEQRGAGWLFLKYLTDRFGGDLLRRLTAASAVGVDNIASATGKRWEDLLSEWAVALYASCLPASERPRTDSRYRYRSLDLERAFASISADGYPLKPVSLPFSDFILSAALPTNGASYMLVTSGSETRGLNLTLTGARGRSAAHPDMQLTLFRVR